jgi:hypothetical protein
MAWERRLRNRKISNKKILIIQEMLNRRIKSGRPSGSEFKPYNE